MVLASKQGWMGFDIGAAGVKAAQLVRRNGAYCIRSAAFAPRRQAWPEPWLATEPPRPSGDEVSCAASLCETVRGRSAAALMPAAACETFSLAAPAGKRGHEHGLASALAIEAQRPMHDCVFAAWPTGLQAGQINAVAAARSWSDQVTADVASSGWRCRLIDALPWALARAVALMAPDATQGTVAALDWGYGRATMCLIHHGVPAMVRILKDCAFRTTLEALARALRLDERDADAALRRFGLGGCALADDSCEPPADATTRSIIAELLEPELARLVHEIRRTLAYWQGATRGRCPDAVYLFGGGCTLADFDQRLSSQLALRAERWRLPLERPDDEHTLPPTCLLGVAAALSALAWEDR
ncbi:MAG: hypothetical protein DCC67_02420 [Planctomycetota bacterium]|nr:MAG: hypothetical protein DCC67_02420 [Planctomycetota bacterium]